MGNDVLAVPELDENLYQNVKKNEFRTETLAKAKNPPPSVAALKGRIFIDLPTNFLNNPYS